MASPVIVHRSSASDFDEIVTPEVNSANDPLENWGWNTVERKWTFKPRNRDPTNDIFMNNSVSSSRRHYNVDVSGARAAQESSVTSPSSSNTNTRDFKPGFFRFTKSQEAPNRCKSPENTFVKQRASQVDKFNGKPSKSGSEVFLTGEDQDETESHDRVKTKLLSVWNNMKYGWTVRLKTNFSRDSPIWFLGQCYHRKLTDGAGSKDGPGLAYGMEGFKQDFISRVWFTYRREFPTLAGSSYTTDCGWGCMLRSGQMLLAQALICHFLGRSWRWQTESSQQSSIHRQIIRYFGDLPASLFSLHKLVAIGESSGKKAGDWYGPASVAHILKQCMEIAAREDSLLKEVCVYVAQDCTVYKQDVLRLCDNLAGESGENGTEDGSLGASGESRWKGVVILVPVRLGGEILNPVYFKCVQAILSNENCIGIIGGRPKHSLYFVGWQDDKLIHLDPHYCQEAVDVRTADFPVQSFHCTSPRKLSFSRMDPSCTIGFYCKTKAEVMKFLSSCNEADYPIFVVAESNEDRVPYDLVQSLSCDNAFPSGFLPEEYGPLSDDEDFGEFVFL